MYVEVLLFITKVIFLILLLFLIKLFIHQLTYWKNKKILHIKSWPLIGVNAQVYFRTASFCDNVKNLYDRFPNASYFCSSDFNTPVVIIRDPELLRDICIKSHDLGSVHDF